MLKGVNRGLWVNFLSLCIGIRMPFAFLLLSLHLHRKTTMSLNVSHRASYFQQQQQQRSATMLKGVEEALS